MAASAEDVVRRWFADCLNGTAWDATTDLFDADFVYHASDGDMSAEDLRKRIEEYRQKYPELLFGIDRLVSDGPVVGVSWHAVTRGGTIFGIGRGIVDGGRLTETWAVVPSL